MLVGDRMASLDGWSLCFLSLAGLLYSLVIEI